MEIDHQGPVHVAVVNLISCPDSKSKIVWPFCVYLYKLTCYIPQYVPGQQEVRWLNFGQDMLDMPSSDRTVSSRHIGVCGVTDYTPDTLGCVM